jgi:hypothetical protein
VVLRTMCRVLLYSYGTAEGEVYRASAVSLVSHCDCASVPSHVSSSICMGLEVEKGKAIPVTGP